MRPKRTFPASPRCNPRARSAKRRPLTDPPASPALTPRQRDVVELLVGTGLSYKQIAARLARSEGTVRTHTERIYRAFGVHSRLELIVALRVPGSEPPGGAASLTATALQQARGGG
ncbi:response regulator transcription factor [Sorangium sp. So ce1078]|uniref:response regulator transcription factor n=1 Tax=Sorangium sp. So ce1078 TaxID=3133329 RepID=UPI003F64057F